MAGAPPPSVVQGCKDAFARGIAGGEEGAGGTAGEGSGCNVMGVKEGQDA